MYDVYINHFKQGNTIIDTEQLMFSVPSQSGFPINKPNVRCGEDSAESFSFSMESSSPYYDSILPLKTLFRVEYDGTTIFYGRAMAPSTSTVYQTKAVTCEGWYALLNDTYYEGVQEKYRNKITISSYLDKIISNHNTMAPAKSITRGTVTSGIMPSSTDKYEPTSWTQTASLLSNLSSNYGGHMRIRYSVSNGTITKYLDWYKYYARDLGANGGTRPSVTIGRNILDISSESDVDSIFTRVIPIGDTNSNGKTIYIKGYNGYSNKYMSVPYIRNLYTDQELTDEFHNYTDYRDAETNFGIIYKTMTFGDADTQAKLWNSCKKWIKDSYFGMATSFSVKAIDFHIQDNTIPMILVGDCVDITFPIIQNGTKVWITKKLVCKSAQYDLFNPENNSYVFGIPSDLLEYNKHNKKSSKQKTVSASSPSRGISSGKEDNELTWHKVWQLIGAIDPPSEYGGTEAANSFYINKEISGIIEAYDPEEYQEALQKYLTYQEMPDGIPLPNTIELSPTPTPKELGITFKANLIGKFSTSGTVKWVAMSSDRGLFACTSQTDPRPVRYWYIKKKGYTYEPSEPTISSFEQIARMINDDGDVTYGGSTNANTFRNNGELHTTVKCYDPDKTSDPATDTDCVFTANVVGWFNSVYVATSTEYGIFAFTKSGGEPYQVRHWYQRCQGLKLDTVSSGISLTSGETEYTIDGLPGSSTSLKLIPGPVSAQGYYYGGLQVGYDSHDPNAFSVNLNLPVKYIGEDKQEHWAYGSVCASDFVLPNKESFKTELIVANSAIFGLLQADTAFFNRMEAVEAYIGEINANNITANSRVAAETMYASVIRASTIRGDDIIVNVAGSQQDPSGASYLSQCYKGCVATSENGVIKLTFTKANNSTEDVNFNMADTAFYRNAVLAARNNVKINAFTSNPNTHGLTYYNTFTYTTDAPTPVEDSKREDTWYLTGGTSWDSNYKTYVFLNYGSTTGTPYAKLEVDASSIAGGGTPSEYRMVYQDNTNYAYKVGVKIGNTWYDNPDNINATHAYDNGWTGAYGNVGISPNIDQTIAPGGSVTINATAKQASGSPNPTNVASISVSCPAISEFRMVYQDDTKYTYKVGAKIGGTWYDDTSTFNATHAYDNGWLGSYNMVDISPDTNQTVAPGGSVTINATAKQASGSSRTNVASVSVSCPAISDYRMVHQDNTNYAYKVGVKIGNTWYDNPDNINATHAYDNGWTNSYGTVEISPSSDQTIDPGGSVTISALAKSTSGAQSKTAVGSVTVTANQASHTVTGFDTTAPSGATSGSYTNNSNGYYISGDNAYIVVKGAWKCDGVTKSAYSYLKAAPTKLYAAGKTAGGKLSNFSVSGYSSKQSSDYYGTISSSYHYAVCFIKVGGVQKKLQVHWE